MAFEKGKSGNPDGRPKGATNQRVKQWDALGEAIMNVHLERFNAMLSTMDDKDFRDTMLDLFEYFKPKLSRTTVVGEQDNPITVNFTPLGRKDK